MKIVLTDRISSRHGLQHSSRRDGGVFGSIHFGKQHHELITALAAHRVGQAYALDEPIGDGLKKLVADRMPQRIVDMLEAIEIQEQHYDFLRVAQRHDNRLSDAVVQKHSIGQAGQEIMLCRMSRLQRQCARLADVAKDDDGSGHLSFAVVDGGDGVFDRSFKSIAPDEDAIRRQVNRLILPDCHIQRIGNGFAAGGVQDLQDFGHRSSGCFPERPAGHCFRDEIEEGDIAGQVRAGDAVADAVERYFGALLRLEQRFFHDVALDGIAERPKEPACLDLGATHDAAFDEVILRTFLQRLRRQGLVVHSRQHHHRDAGCCGAGPPQRSQALRIGQREIEQNDVDLVLGKMFFRLAHAFHVDQCGSRRGRLVEYLPKQTRISGVVFNQQNRLD